MKKIGLIGGISWNSSLLYYKIINEKVKEKLGGLHSAKCVLESVNFSEIEALQHKNDWESLDEMMANLAQNLENSKAEMILVCANTMHLCSEAIKNSTNIPLIHIAEATGKKIKEQNISKVLLLGTKFTMEKDFYRNILEQNYGLEVIIPNAEEREVVNNVIYDELAKGEILESSKKQYIQIINNAIKNGAEGVILGCTEIPLLINSSDVSIPVFDTTTIHAESAVEFALS